MEKGFKLNETKSLIIDRVLFDAGYPILFICMDERSELYLCVCSQNNEKGKKWLLTKTTPALVMEMLTDRITIRDAFLKFPDCRISVTADERGLQMKENEMEDWKEDSVYLPKAGEYMEAEEGEFDEEIAYYRQMEEQLYRNRSFHREVQIEWTKGTKSEVLKDIPGGDGNKRINSRVLYEVLSRSIEMTLDNRQSVGRYKPAEGKSIQQRKLDFNSLQYTAQVEIKENATNPDAA